MNRKEATRRLIRHDDRRGMVNGWLVTPYFAVAGRLLVQSEIPAMSTLPEHMTDKFPASLDRWVEQAQWSVDWLGGDYPIGWHDQEGPWCYLLRVNGDLIAVSSKLWDPVDALVPDGSEAWGSDKYGPIVVFADGEPVAVAMSVLLPSVGAAADALRREFGEDR